MNIGERVGDYEIVQILGAGGMGEVYKVRNVISNRIEAMKVLLPNLGGDPGLSERFLREIQVQATLDHPNIARLHTAYMAGEQIVMILEYVEGATIEKVLEQGTMGVRECIAYMRQVLDALEYAHERSVIHRDIKPANIMRTSKGSIKLMDFGIARVQQDRRLTQTGSTVGSLFYMSPEQIRGAPPEPRSDLYSLGITLYEMVTGRRPFQGTSDYSVMAAHLQQTPIAPIEVVPGVPPQVNDIILKAIAKDPAERFQSAGEFRSALEAVAAPPVIAHTVTAPRMPPPIPQAPAVAPAFLPPPPPPPQQVFAPPPFIPPMAQAMPQTSSKRGLYMTLGSIATVGVIALAIFFVPRFFGTGAANLPGPQTVPQTANEPAPPTVPPVQQNTPPPASTEPLPAQPAANVPPAAQVPPVQQPPVRTPPVAAQQNPAPRTTPAPIVVQQQAPPAAPIVQQQAPPAAPIVQQQAAPTPVVQQQAPPPVVQQQPPPAPTPQQAQGTPAVRQAPVTSPELNDLRQDYNLVSIRVGAAKNGLKNFEQQQRRQGLNLRGDMVEAESRMDYLMKESMDSIRAGDAAMGRRNLQMAERALETVEKFLGR